MQRIGRKQKKGSFNFRQAKVKEHGCKNCEHNPMGICEIVGKELGYQYCLYSGRPVWCPLKKKGCKK